MYRWGIFFTFNLPNVSCHSCKQTSISSGQLPMHMHCCSRSCRHPTTLSLDSMICSSLRETNSWAKILRTLCDEPRRCQEHSPYGPGQPGLRELYYIQFVCMDMSRPDCAPMTKTVTGGQGGQVNDWHATRLPAAEAACSIHGHMV